MKEQRIVIVLNLEIELIATFCFYCIWTVRWYIQRPLTFVIVQEKENLGMVELPKISNN